MKPISFVIVYLVGMIIINPVAHAKNYTEADIQKKDNVYYDMHNVPITGKVLSKSNPTYNYPLSGKTLALPPGSKYSIDIKNGKRDGNMVLYIQDRIRIKHTYKMGKLKAIDSYWSNGNLKLHNPVFGEFVDPGQPTKGYYKNGKPMFVTDQATKLYDHTGKLFAQLDSNSFCISNGKKYALPLHKANILAAQINEMFNNPLGDKEPDFTNFRCINQ